MISSSLSSKVWNPYSLLHIPLYGVLMISLVLTLAPNIPSRKKVSFIVLPFFLPGGIAAVVGILDEVNQIYIPDRDASVMDVMLDILGIVLTAIFIHFNRQRKRK